MNYKGILAITLLCSVATAPAVKINWNSPKVQRVITAAKVTMSIGAVAGIIIYLLKQRHHAAIIQPATASVQENTSSEQAQTQENVDQDTQTTNAIAEQLVSTVISNAIENANEALFNENLSSTEPTVAANETITIINPLYQPRLRIRSAHHDTSDAYAELRKTTEGQQLIHWLIKRTAYQQ